MDESAFTESNEEAMLYQRLLELEKHKVQKLTAALKQSQVAPPTPGLSLDAASDAGGVQDFAGSKRKRRDSGPMFMRENDRLRALVRYQQHKFDWLTLDASGEAPGDESARGQLAFTGRDDEMEELLDQVCGRATNQGQASQRRPSGAYSDEQVPSVFSERALSDPYIKSEPTENATPTPDSPPEPLLAISQTRGLLSVLRLRTTPWQLSSPSAPPASILQAVLALEQTVTHLAGNWNWLALSKIHGCLNRYPRSNLCVWTVAFPEQYACMTCTNLQKPCVLRNVATKVWELLPLAPEARAPGIREGDEGLWIAGQKGWTKRVGQRKVWEVSKEYEKVK